MLGALYFSLSLILLFHAVGVTRPRWLGQTVGLIVSVPLLVAKLAVGGALLALIETLNAKVRIFRAPEFLGTAFLFAVLGLLVRLLLESRA